MADNSEKKIDDNLFNLHFNFENLFIFLKWIATPIPTPTFVLDPSVKKSISLSCL